MGLLDGDLAATFGAAFSGIYLDATLHRATITFNGSGGGSASYADEPVKAQLTSTTEAMRSSENYVDSDQRILVLAYNIDPITSEDEITVKGRRWSIADVNQDPAAARYEMRGRLSGYVAPPDDVIVAAAMSAASVGGFGWQASSIAPLAVSDFENDNYSIGGVSKSFAEMWEENTDIDPHDPATIVPGDGWKIGPDGIQRWDALVSTTALFDAVDPHVGFTAVAKYLTDAPGSAYSTFIMSAVDLPGFNTSWAFEAEYWNPANPALNFLQITDYSHSPQQITGVPQGHKVVAITMTPALLAFSVNGDAATIYPFDPNDNQTSNVIALDNQGGGGAMMCFEKITFYPPLDASALTLLSAP